MSRTSPVTLVLLAGIAALLGVVVDLARVGAGMPVLPLPPTVGVVLGVIGIVLVGLAWPVRRMVRGGRPVGFRHATSVLGLAKASSLVAALVGGWAVGTGLLLLTRAIVPVPALGMAIVALVGAVVLLVAALLAESWCALPPEDEGASPA